MHRATLCRRHGARLLNVRTARWNATYWKSRSVLQSSDALRAGDLNLAESRKHVSFWNLVYDENQRDSCLQN
jgi:hypothetical protein